MPWILPSVAIGVPIGAQLIRQMRSETFRRICMSFDAWVVGFGLSKLLHDLEDRAGHAGLSGPAGGHRDRRVAALSVLLASTAATGRRRLATDLTIRLLQVDIEQSVCGLRGWMCACCCTGPAGPRAAGLARSTDGYPLATTRIRLKAREHLPGFFFVTMTQ